MITPIVHCWNQMPAAMPTTPASTTPFSSPTRISRISSQRAFACLDLAEREAADDQHQRLTAGDAAHAGDDRHQHGERDDFLDRRFEQADDVRGEKRGREIDAQPDRTAPRAGAATPANMSSSSSRPAMLMTE